MISKVPQGAAWNTWACFRSSDLGQEDRWPWEEGKEESRLPKGERRGTERAEGPAERARERVCAGH